MAFRFRQFIIEDDRSTLRVGTDAMLLGSWARPPVTGRILDIGTGCGVIALMLAQKSGAFIDAVEPDLLSARQACENFEKSPWPSRLRVLETTLQEIGFSPQNQYDLIVSNPPYYSNQLKSNDSRKNISRHQVTLQFSELYDHITRLLKPSGTLCMILPCKAAAEWHKIIDNRLNLRRQLNVITAPGKPVSRVLMEFIFCPDESCLKPETQTLTIKDTDTGYSNDYLKLTQDYHYFTP